MRSDSSIALALGRSVRLAQGGSGAAVRYGTVRSVAAGRAVVDVDGGTVEAPCTTCVPADARGRRAVVAVDGQSATVLGVLGEPPDADVAADKVVGSGADPDTGWSWVKWESGAAECWKSFDTSDALANQYGSFYYSSYVSTLPFAFVETPQPHGSVKCDAGLGFVCFDANTTTEKIGFMLCSPVAESTGPKSVHLCVKGRWKQ